MKLKNYLQNLANLKQIDLIGASGTETSEIAIFLDKFLPTSSRPNIALHDFAANPAELLKSFQSSHQSYPLKSYQAKLKKFQNLPFPIHYASSYLKNISHSNLIFLPQSWFLYPQNQLLKNFIKKIPFDSLSELYLKLAPCPIIGVTGSNGKSTTTFLIHHLLKSTLSPTRQAYLTGNDRQATQILEKIDQITPQDLIVTELSNRQLFTLNHHSPHIAVITSLSKNHLSEHKNFQEYLQAKAKITQFQTPKDHLLFNPNCQHSQAIASTSQAKLHPINPTSPLQLPPSLIGDHNKTNALLAIQVAKLLKIPQPKILNALHTFKPLKDRLSQIATYQKAPIFSDRQGTSIDATVHALLAVPSPTALILGGQNKKMPLAPLIQTIKSTQAIVIAIKSPFSQELLAHLEPGQYHLVSTLTQAVKQAKILLDQQLANSVLFSPACEYGPYFNKLPQHKDAETFRLLSKEVFEN